jgi:divalent metal cation (Fe/Co/Zn/Cd) transporter
MFLILLIGTLSKIVLYYYCQWANSPHPLYPTSDLLSALSEDHLNDIMSNVTAFFTSYVAFNYHAYWYIDQVGAIFISFVIIWRWVDVISDQVKKIVGYTASEEFLQKITQIANSHDPLGRLKVDVIRAYHFGKAYLVEIEIILPELMTVRESHDIALELQHKIEEYPNVERAFVHVSVNDG